MTKSPRPILLISNSSWYLYHYRKLLIKTIQNKKEYIIALCPSDSFSKKLSELLIHIPWRMNRVRNQSIYSGLISFIRMLLIVRAIKPKLIHSHTLQANLITSIVCSFFGINTVFSFAGIGRFSKSNKFLKTLFFLIFRLIFLFSCYERTSKFGYKYNPKRSILIFQNNSDLELISSNILQIKKYKHFIVPGSGVPKNYINSKKSNFSNSFIRDFENNNFKKKNIKLDLIYCARLLRSKGILKFLNLSKIYSIHNFWVFGSIDISSNDSLTDLEIKKFKKQFKNVNFLGNKKDPLLNNKFDYPVLITPSNYGEGFPRGIIEANVLKIPVIASESAAEKINIKNLTYTSKGESNKDYSLCIEDLIRDINSGTIIEKLKKVRRKVIKNYSEKLIVKQTMQIYDSFENKNLSSYLLNKDSDNINI